MSEAEPIFVVQHHLATADHYDVRFEIDGVLVSWAVPKGPSTDPRVRRLARRTGDHDLAYAGYEGVLGARRGGGTVQVWDRGTFRTIAARDRTPVRAADALTAGHLSVELTGEKLDGGWTMIRTRGDDLWLMIKRRDAAAHPGNEPTIIRPESVLTGRTLPEITEQG